MNDFEKLERYSPVYSRTVVEISKDGCFIDFLEALIIYNRLLEENKKLQKRIEKLEKQAKHVDAWSQIINMD